MKIPFGAITITPLAKKLAMEALESGRLSSGRLVRQFEQRFAELIGAKEAVAVSSGADAVALALACLYDRGAARGDEIILPALSFVATGNAVLQAGFTPVFVDVQRETLNIAPDLIESAITAKTRAILPVHLMGKPAEMDAICDIARRHKLAVVEDAAEAHGAKYKGRNAGTIGDLAAFSLYVAHIITSIEGGIVTTNDAELAGVLRSLRCHGRACKCDSCVVNTGSGECRRRFAQGTDIRFIFERIGFSAKMNELEAAVGLGSLELYDLIVSRRHTNLMAMMGVIRGFEPLLQTFRQEKHEFLGPHALPVLVGPEAPFTRDELVVYLAEKGVDTRSLFASMPTQCAGFAFLGRRLGEFPQAEYIGEHGFHVGVHQEVTPEQIDYFRDVLAEFLKERA